MEDIIRLRETIDSIDKEMAALFEKRFEAAGRIAEYKSSRGLPVEDRAREQKLIEKNSTLIEDERLRAYYAQFLQSTMDISKKWQHRLIEGIRVAYCERDGEEGRSPAGLIYPDAAAVVYPNYDDAYNAVSSGDCDIAVLPFEKSYTGEVGRVLDLIFAGDLYVTGTYSIDEKDGTTRYAVLSKTENSTGEGASYGSFMVMFTVRDEVGGLAKAVNTISAYNFNMRIMRSRPMKDLPWHYYFYAEAEGDDNSENGRRMIRALSAVCPLVKVAGRYSSYVIDTDGGLPAVHEDRR